ncbi:UDP-N-acetylglucosamine:LPS N-acetylglucosamine transferase [Lentibacillus halodurans]|uniref:UDP-N-acetylglucosamine:LPS N-acetylglucosamine transferase n=1 Tax=Lentibacillus halodurans TaxID=237679 RepID=A0A1I0WIN4_9BACI|nr:glycosyltransferase [Lentibacillus halodurans]SFA88619.1 UDP-N-acetylglucosamine:LPS N-acetylglucosamine transferase [Lentibacillus halodurans]
MEKEKALFLPFMQIPTGHHHVADALMTEIQSFHNNIVCDKVDILSYSYGRMEKVISSAYLNWIKFFPDSYDWLYRRTAYSKTPLHNRQYLYEAMFIYFFKRLTSRHNASILFCTHALPSNIASVLKMKKQLPPVTVNVYTDFFINGVWGIDGIDYHFAPTLAVKKYLMEKGVRPERIYVTGIPIDQAFQTGHGNEKTKDGVMKVLVTGGSLGVGSLKRLLRTLKSDNIHYFVLCGKNEALYQELHRNHRKTVTPLPYIANKTEMNMLYDQVDAVLTKPGGVTVSECLMKRKPIFLYNPLPGQEKINAEQLKQMGVAISADMDENLEEQLWDFFTDVHKQKMYGEKINAYHHNLDKRPLSILMTEMIEKKH